MRSGQGKAHLQKSSARLLTDAKCLSNVIDQKKLRKKNMRTTRKNECLSDLRTPIVAKQRGSRAGKSGRRPKQKKL